MRYAIKVNLQCEFKLDFPPPPQASGLTVVVFRTEVEPLPPTGHLTIPPGSTARPDPVGIRGDE